MKNIYLYLTCGLLSFASCGHVKPSTSKQEKNENAGGDGGNDAALNVSNNKTSHIKDCLTQDDNEQKKSNNIINNKSIRKIDPPIQQHNDNNTTNGKMSNIPKKAVRNNSDNLITSQKDISDEDDKLDKLPRTAGNNNAKNNPNNTITNNLIINPASEPAKPLTIKPANHLTTNNNVTDNDNLNNLILSQEDVSEEDEDGKLDELLRIAGDNNAKNNPNNTSTNNSIINPASEPAKPPKIKPEKPSVTRSANNPILNPKLNMLNKKNDNNKTQDTITRNPVSHEDCESQITKLREELTKVHIQLLNATNAVCVQQKFPTVQETLNRFRSICDQEHADASKSLKQYINNKASKKLSKNYLSQVVHKIMFETLVLCYNEVVKYKEEMFNNIANALKVGGILKKNNDIYRFYMMEISQKDDNRIPKEIKSLVISYVGVDNDCMKILTNCLNINCFLKENYESILKKEELEEIVLKEICTPLFSEHIHNLFEDEKTDLLQDTKNNLRSYIDKCLSVCRIMVLEDPVLEIMPIIWEENNNVKFDEGIHRKVLGSDRGGCEKIVYYKWPAIVQNGFILGDQRIDVVSGERLYNISGKRKKHEMQCIKNIKYHKRKREIPKKPTNNDLDDKNDDEKYNKTEASLDIKNNEQQFNNDLNAQGSHTKCKKEIKNLTQDLESARNTFLEMTTIGINKNRPPTVEEFRHKFFNIYKGGGSYEATLKVLKECMETDEKYCDNPCFNYDFDMENKRYCGKILLNIKIDCSNKVLRCKEKIFNKIKKALDMQNVLNRKYFVKFIDPKDSNIIIDCFGNILKNNYKIMLDEEKLIEEIYDTVCRKDIKNLFKKEKVCKLKETIKKYISQWIHIYWLCELDKNYIMKIDEDEKKSERRRIDYKSVE